MSAENREQVKKMVRIKTVTLVNGWHDDNKGDSGIAEATLLLLKDLLPDVRLGLISILPEGNSELPRAYRHLTAGFPDLEIAPSPVPDFSPEGHGGKYLGGAAWMGRILLSATRLMLPFSPKGPAVDLIDRSDLLIFNGGHYLHNRRPNNPVDIAKMFRLLYPALVANKKAKPYVIFGQSLGPFADNLGRSMTRHVFNRSVGVFLRENLSAEIAREIGTNREKVAVIPDAAFALKPVITSRVEAIMARNSLTPGNFWVVTVRQWPHGPQEKSEAMTKIFLDEMAVFVREILRRDLTSRVALVAHTIGPAGTEDDRLPTRALHMMLEKESVALVEDDLSPREMVGLYSQAGFMVGTRFHSMIFSMAGGTPGLAISYFGPKAWGIMESLDMKHLCLDMEKFKAAEALDRVLQVDVKSERERIASKVEGFRTLLQSAVRQVAEQYQQAQ